jgi:hypothetical protein
MILSDSMYYSHQDYTTTVNFNNVFFFFYEFEQISFVVDGVDRKTVSEVENDISV